MPSGVYKRTEETKRKMSETMKKAWIDGKLSREFSEEHKRKISKNNARYWLGKHPSEETRKKLSEANKGNTNGIQNLIPFKKGNVPWVKGRKASKETLKKLSESHKGQVSWLKGKKMPKKLKEKLMQARQKQWHSKEPTSIEKRLYEELKARGILFEKQRLINGRFIVDAYIPSLNLVIEADGDYWHGLDRVMKKDKAENAYLKKCGFNLLRISGTEIRNDAFIEKLNQKGVN